MRGALRNIYYHITTRQTTKILKRLYEFSNMIVLIIIPLRNYYSYDGMFLTFEDSPSVPAT